MIIHHHFYQSHSYLNVCCFKRFSSFYSNIFQDRPKAGRGKRLQPRRWLGYGVSQNVLGSCTVMDKPFFRRSPKPTYCQTSGPLGEAITAKPSLIIDNYSGTFVSRSTEGCRGLLSLTSERRKSLNNQRSTHSRKPRSH